MSIDAELTTFYHHGFGERPSRTLVARSRSPIRRDREMSRLDQRREMQHHEHRHEERRNEQQGQTGHRAGRRAVSDADDLAGNERPDGDRDDEIEQAEQIPDDEATTCRYLGLQADCNRHEWRSGANGDVAKPSGPRKNAGQDLEGLQRDEAQAGEAPRLDSRSQAYVESEHIVAKAL